VNSKEREGGRCRPAGVSMCGLRKGGQRARRTLQPADRVQIYHGTSHRSVVYMNERHELGILRFSGVFGITATITLKFSHLQAGQAQT
jgi:hypothetical protein